jgi:hypothetical protein
MKRLKAATVLATALALAPAHAETTPRNETKLGMPGQVLEYGCSYTLTHATRVFNLTMTDSTGSYTAELVVDTVPLWVEIGVRNGVVTQKVEPLPPSSGVGLGFAKAIRLTQPTLISMSWALAQDCSLTLV